MLIARRQVPGHPVISVQKNAWRTENKEKLPITLDRAIRQTVEVVRDFLEQVRYIFGGDAIFSGALTEPSNLPSG